MSEVRCGMSVSEVEVIAGRRARSLSGVMGIGTHVVEHGLHRVRLEFRAEGLVSAQPGWTAALKLVEMGEVREICE